MMKISSLFFVGSMLFTANNVMAADWEPCTSTSGVHDYPVNFDIDIMDASKNKAGTELRLIYSWAGVGQPFSFICECPDTYKTEKDTLIKVVSNLSTATRKINSEQYYRLTDELEVMTMIQGPSVFFRVPEANSQIPNLNNSSQDCKGNNLGQFGSNGYLSFYIAKPVQGEVEIPYTLIATMYASKKKNTYRDPLSTVSIAGKLTFTQGCKIDAGTVLDVPFGEYPSSAFKNKKGTIPVGGTEKEINLQFDCENITDGIQVSLRIEGNTSQADERAIDMGNPDIGVLVMDPNGNVLRPNDTNSSVNLNLGSNDSQQHRDATIKLKAAPISTTGNAPAAGQYSGVATIFLDMD
ncbi:fimbrial family protein [Escherichia coli 1-176-05_S3_C2]|uniref:fimbrial protein n=1 Tax=Escherichia TaxID=561 RepID=UPI0004539795|nr:fimbrial family protein [Escherichia coli 1-176-05_S3_C2]WGM51005.1 fimbrial protein [Escherichia ruysiae]HAL9678795.1 fimbrial protein [Escherichia coli]HAV7816157.1 fimbrial protein [Escherichia coli]HAW5069794.1 fimbrial protein [Escherichia coli]